MADESESAKLFQLAVTSVRQLLSQYCPEDVALALFASSVWLPNIGAQIKHLLWATVFTGMNADEFTAKRRIVTHADLAELTESLYPALPHFPQLEDYVPECDWGDVKFHHDGANYAIFYGGEIGNTHDWLLAFQMMYCSMDEEYVKCSARSPVAELRQCLELQDSIITNISAQRRVEALELPLGHIELPSEDFWSNICRCYQNYRPEDQFDLDFVRCYSTVIGSGDSPDIQSFHDGVCLGTILPFFFIVCGGKHFPLLPRRFPALLLDSWGRVFCCFRDIMLRDNSYLRKLNTEMCSFIQRRFSRNSHFRFAGPVHAGGKSSGMLFPSAILTGDRLVLIHILPPFATADELERALTEISPRIEEAVRLIGTPPVRLALHMDEKVVEFANEHSSKRLQPFPILVVCPATMQAVPIAIPPALFDRMVLFLDQFLAIMDDITEVNELNEFIDYLEDVDAKTSAPFISVLDKYGSFRDSHGVLCPGAREPDWIALDPQWGSNYRYKSLTGFWRLFPENGFFDHPRSWKVEQESLKTIRLTARGYFGCALCSEIGSSAFFANAPFDKMTYEQGLIANLLMESLVDSLSAHAPDLAKSSFFQKYKQCQVSFFPWSLVSADDRLSHLRHLSPEDSLWCLDTGWIERRVPGVRVVYNDALVAEAFGDAVDRTSEIELATQVIKRLMIFAPDCDVDAAISDISKEAKDKPRYTIFTVQKEVAFPEFVPAWMPSAHHYKKAAKRVAELALKADLGPGSYTLAQAKRRLNSLRQFAVQELEAELHEFDYKAAIPFLIARVDALNHRYERTRLSVKRSLQHQVDYVREVRLSSDKADYLRQHRDCTYLTEKVVQLLPHGTACLKPEVFQHLIAFVDRLNLIYRASDVLHYDIAPVGLEIDSDYVINVVHEPGFEERQQAFGEEIAAIDLGLIGNKDDNVDLPRPIRHYMNSLDIAFEKDLGFTLTNMVQLLAVLAHWPGFCSDEEESACYFAEEADIRDCCVAAIEGVRAEVIPNILAFLTLKQEGITHVVGAGGDVTVCDDLPVWEHKKRPARYNLRPLMRIGDKYCWGPYSVRRSGMIWSNITVNHALPAEIRCPSVRKAVRDIKEDVEVALVDKTVEVLKRFTSFADRNVYLHTRDKAGNHPIGLGDYDVLAFIPDRHLVVFIEDKDILPAFCLKDARQVRDRIFGRSDRLGGYLQKVEKRATYLEANLSRIGEVLGWPFGDGMIPRVVTLFVLGHPHWWAKFPPRATEVRLTCIELLERSLQELL